MTNQGCTEEGSPLEKCRVGLGLTREDLVTLTRLPYHVIKHIEEGHVWRLPYRLLNELSTYGVDGNALSAQHIAFMERRRDALREELARR